MGEISEVGHSAVPWKVSWAGEAILKYGVKSSCRIRYAFGNLDKGLADRVGRREVH